MLLRPLLALVCLVTPLGATPVSALVIRVPADQPTIQDAVDAAAAGDEIQISGGRYAEAVLVDGKTGITLRGKGRAVIDGQGAFVPLTIQNSSGVRVEKLGLENSASDNVLIEASSDVSVVKCRIVGGARDGILARDASGLLLERNKIEDVGLDGIGLSDDELLPVVDSTAVKNKILRAGEDGIEVEGTGNTLEGNKIIEVLDDGIDVDSDDNTILRNKVVRAGDEGVEIEEGNRNRFEGNKISQPDDDGFDVEGDDNVFVGNKVKGAGDDGIEVEADDLGDPSTGNLFENNKVSASGGDGFQASSGGNTFRGNKAKKSAGFDLNDDSLSGTNVYENNRFGTEQVL